MSGVLVPLREAVDAVVGVDTGTVATAELAAMAVAVRREAERLIAVAARWLADAEQAGVFARQGVRSGAHYLAKQTGTSLKSARSAALLGATLNHTPVLADAVAAGELSCESAAVVGSVAEHPAFAAHGDELVDAVKGAGPAATRTAVDTWKAIHRECDSDVDEEAVRRAKRSLTFTPRADGLVDVSGVLTAVDSRVIQNALDHLRRKTWDDGSGRTHTQRMADALVELCALYNSGAVTGGRERPTILVTVPYETIFERAGKPGYASTGEVLSPEVIRRLCCDANLHRIVTRGESEILDFGRAVRTAPHEHWLALVERDGRCRWKDCEEPPQRCEVHHEPPWEDGGRTNLDEEVLLCDHHHDKRHERGWTATLHPDGAFTVTGPDGYTFTTRPGARRERTLFDHPEAA